MLNSQLDNEVVSKKYKLGFFDNKIISIHSMCTLIKKNAFINACERK